MGTNVKTLTDEQIDAIIADLLPLQFEIHLSGHDTDFPKKYGKKVKAVGGKYSECRGYSSARFVKLAHEHKDLINKILNECDGDAGLSRRGDGRATVVVVRGNGYDAVVTLTRPAEDAPATDLWRAALKGYLREAYSRRGDLPLGPRFTNGAAAPITFTEQQQVQDAVTLARAEQSRADHERAGVIVDQLAACLADPAARMHFYYVLAEDVSVGWGSGGMATLEKLMQAAAARAKLMAAVEPSVNGESLT